MVHPGDSPTDGIPADVRRRHFKASSGKEGHYAVWEARPGIWYWACKGNNGEEATEWDAQEAARRWIRDQ